MTWQHTADRRERDMRLGFWHGCMRRAAAARLKGKLGDVAYWMDCARKERGLFKTWNHYVRCNERAAEDAA